MNLQILLELYDIKKSLLEQGTSEMEPITKKISTIYQKLEENGKSQQMKYKMTPLMKLISLLKIFLGKLVGYKEDLTLLMKNLSADISDYLQDPQQIGISLEIVVEMIHQIEYWIEAKNKTTQIYSEEFVMNKIEEISNLSFAIELQLDQIKSRISNDNKEGPSFDELVNSFKQDVLDLTSYTDLVEFRNLLKKMENNLNTLISYLYFESKKSSTPPKYELLFPKTEEKEKDTSLQISTNTKEKDDINETIKTNSIDTEDTNHTKEIKIVELNDGKTSDVPKDEKEGTNMELIHEKINQIVLDNLQKNKKEDLKSSIELHKLKGLENKHGENNCFLNVIIQGLWNLKEFHSYFVSSQQNTKFQHQHNCLCVYCALKEIFMNYKWSEEEVIPPFILRQSLQKLYQSQSKFQFNELADANEALEAILECLDKVWNCKNENKEEDVEVSYECKECISHDIFGIQEMEVIKCDKCNFSDISKTSNNYFAYVPAIGILQSSQPSFEKIVYEQIKPHRKTCDQNECKFVCNSSLYLLKNPPIYTIGIAWEEDVNQENLLSVLYKIQPFIDLSQIYDCSSPESPTSSPSVESTSVGGVQSKYYLRGMVLYNLKHYSCYFYSLATKKWMVFDDSIVKEIGDTFESVLDRCLNGHLKPTLLFYSQSPN